MGGSLHMTKREKISLVDMTKSSKIKLGSFIICMRVSFWRGSI